MRVKRKVRTISEQDILEGKLDKRIKAIMKGNV